jgi:hypothetical protein
MVQRSLKTCSDASTRPSRSAKPARLGRLAGICHVERGQAEQRARERGVMAWKDDDAAGDIRNAKRFRELAAFLRDRAGQEGVKLVAGEAEKYWPTG